MTTTPSMTTFSVTPSSYINGASNSYTISAQTTLPLVSTDKL